MASQDSVDHDRRGCRPRERAVSARATAPPVEVRSHTKSRERLQRRTSPPTSVRSSVWPSTVRFTIAAPTDLAAKKQVPMSREIHPNESVPHRLNTPSTRPPITTATIEQETAIPSKAFAADSHRAHVDQVLTRPGVSPPRTSAAVADPGADVRWTSRMHVADRPALQGVSGPSSGRRSRTRPHGYSGAIYGYVCLRQIAHLSLDRLNRRASSPSSSSHSTCRATRSKRTTWEGAHARHPRRRLHEIPRADLAGVCTQRFDRPIANGHAETRRKQARSDHQLDPTERLRSSSGPALTKHAGQIQPVDRSDH